MVELYRGGNTLKIYKLCKLERGGGDRSNKKKSSQPNPPSNRWVETGSGATVVRRNMTVEKISNSYTTSSCAYCVDAEVRIVTHFHTRVIIRPSPDGEGRIITHVSHLKKI